ncbi:MAG: universal stress protein [Candidatus Odinarchaeota archaeon]
MAFDWGQLDRILLPLRGFPAEIHAINFALYLSEATGAKLQVLHVEKTVLQSKEYDVNALLQKLEERASKIGVKFDFLAVKSDSARTALLSHLKDNTYDLIVMGTQSSQGFPYDLHKSVSVAIANNLPPKTAALVVVQGDHSDWEFKERDFNRIMVGYRPSIDNSISIKLASLLTSSATKADNDIYVARMVKIPKITPLESVKDILMEVESEFLHSLSEYLVTIQKPLVPKIVVGHSYGKAIAYLARKEEVDLLLLGVVENFSLAGFKNTPIWRIAKAGACPVAYVFTKLHSKEED